jgi:hypothetical protein
MKYLSGETPAAHTQDTAVTIEEAIKRYLAEKQSALPPPRPVALSDAVISFRKTKTTAAVEQGSLRWFSLAYRLPSPAEFWRSCFEDRHSRGVPDLQSRFSVPTKAPVIRTASN